MASHLGLDFNRVEDLMARTTLRRGPQKREKAKFYAHLAIVDSDNGTNHFRNNDHVPEVGLDHCGLFVGRGLLLGLSQLLDQTQGLALEAAVETPTGAGMNNLECTPIRINQEGKWTTRRIHTSTSFKEGEVS